MKRIGWMLVLALALSACIKEEDQKITTRGAEKVVLNCSADELVLKKENASNLALSMLWNDNSSVATTGYGRAAAGSVTNTLQLSGSEDFARYATQNIAKGVTYCQLNVDQLNKLCIRAGLESEKRVPLYIRMASSVGSNVTPVYSDVIRLYVTTFPVDMSHAYVMAGNTDSKGSLTPTGQILTATSEGIYEGFMNAGGWMNWFLQEGDETLWGNVGEDGHVFEIDASETNWNMWFPGTAGCYYVTVDTKDRQWIALNLPELSLSGDLSGTMSYYKPDNTWTFTFEAEAKTYSLLIGGTGKQYDKSTGDGASTDKTVGFAGTADEVTFGTEAGAISVTATSAGTLTLKLNLDDMTLKMEEGGAPVVVIPPYIYPSGVKPTWNFDSYLVLYDEDKLSYAGACMVNSAEGYRYYTEKDNWDEFYGKSSGDAASGTIDLGLGNNIDAPSPGFYLMKVSLADKTYSTTPITRVSMSGFNGEWELLEMTATENEGEYNARVTLTDATPDGFIFALNNLPGTVDWNDKFGGKDGKLVYVGGNNFNIPLPAEFAVGDELDVTVDLVKGTYSVKKYVDPTEPIDPAMQTAKVLDSDKADTGILLTATAKGVYEGFIGATAWMNWFLQEGDDTLWGNVGESGHTFELDSSDSRWNLWFPGSTGCYYVKADTGNKRWETLYLPSVKVEGDIDATMTYDRSAGQWKAGFTAAAGNYSLTLSGTGTRYNATTGDSAGSEEAFGFAGRSDAVRFGSSASAISLSCSVSGEATLVLDMAAMTLSVESGSTPTESVPEKLYLAGATEGEGTWNFNYYLCLYDEGTRSYAGACPVNSAWGYKYYKEANNWDDNYGMMDGGTAASGTLVSKGESNITAPEAGLYLMKASLENLSYSTTAITEVSITGFNGDWTLSAMTATANAGEYTATVSLTAETPYGFAIVLNGSTDWNNKFGGSDGKLVYVGGANDKNIPLGSEFAVGDSLLVTADLCKGTYKIEKQ